MAAGSRECEDTQCCDELNDPKSILQFYRQLLVLHHQNLALLDGDYVALNQDDPNVLAYLRRYKNEAVLVVLNMSATAQHVSFNLSSRGIFFREGPDFTHDLGACAHWSAGQNCCAAIRRIHCSALPMRSHEKN